MLLLIFETLIVFRVSLKFLGSLNVCCLFLVADDNEGDKKKKDKKKKKGEKEEKEKEKKKGPSKATVKAMQEALAKMKEEEERAKREEEERIRRLEELEAKRKEEVLCILQSSLFYSQGNLNLSLCWYSWWISPSYISHQ